MQDGLTFNAKDEKRQANNDKTEFKNKKAKFDKRMFHQPKYEQTYNWLYYSHNPDNKGFMCKFCEIVLCDKTPFSGVAVDLGTHPTRKLDKHEQSSKHKTSMARLSSSGCKYNVYKQIMKNAEEQQLDMKEKNRNFIKKLFKCMYFLVKNKFATTDNFEKFVRFVADLGVDDLLDHLQKGDASRRATYLSSTTVTELINITSEYLESKLLQSIRGKKYSLLADESTDSKNCTQLSIMCKWLSELVIEVHYMGIVHIEGSATSEALMTAIDTFLRAKGVPICDVRFTGFDGCNTMSGDIKGVQR